MKALLADTGPIYALVDPDDQYHDRARRELERISGEIEILVVWPILLEAYTLIMRKLGPLTGQRWLVEMTAGVTLLNPTASDYQDAIGRIARYPDQSITLFDAILGSLSERLDLPVWTYDFHFDVLRVSVWREG